MPAQYKAIKRSYMKRGKSEKEASRIAAMTWNKEHPEDPNPWNREKKMMHTMPRYKRKS